MRLQDLAADIRAARTASGLTQAALAKRVGLSRETLSLLENGRAPDLGAKKIFALLDALGLGVAVESQLRRPDYVRMACATANVSFRHSLTEEELISALVTGKVPPDREAHIRALFEEAPATLLAGLASEAARWTKPGKLQANLRKLATDVGATRKVDEWLKIG